MTSSVESEFPVEEVVAVEVEEENTHRVPFFSAPLLYRVPGNSSPTPPLTGWINFASDPPGPTLAQA